MRIKSGEEGSEIELFLERFRIILNPTVWLCVVSRRVFRIGFVLISFYFSYSIFETPSPMNKLRMLSSHNSLTIGMNPAFVPYEMLLIFFMPFG